MSLSVNIQKKLGNFQLDIKFQAEQEVLALLGASGCGKSVTLRCIAGILTPDTGRIILDDVILFDSDQKINLPPQKRRIGYLFQNYALFPHMTVYQNIAVAIQNRSRREREAITRQKLRQFQLESVADLRPGQISGGQRQRTALARVLASEPGAILLDEPFSALDSYLKASLELELTEILQNFPGPILWVSHDRGEVFRNCQRVCVIDQGISQPVIHMTDFIAHPVTEAAARLSGCENFFDILPKGRFFILPEWGLTFSYHHIIPENIRRIGIRAREVQLVNLINPENPTDLISENNPFCCKMIRVIHDINRHILLLRPENAPEHAPLLRMELDFTQEIPDRNKPVFIKIPPNSLLFLQE